MSDVFPKWANQLPRNLVIGALLVVTGMVAALTYYFTPKYTDMGYQPSQPVAFSHNTHVNQTGLDCRYCHNGVEKSRFANLPATSTCMNCHNQILKDDPRLALVRESAATGKAIPWVRVHKLPDYVYFNHAVHMNRGVSCLECHGSVNKMEEVSQVQSLSMAFCLECHRNPARRLRPLAHVAEMDWLPTTNAAQLAQVQQGQGEALIRELKIQTLENCSTCHR